MGPTRTSRATSDGGWILVDVLVALGLVAVALGQLAPALANLRRVHERRIELVFSAAEAPPEDPWKDLR